MSPANHSCSHVSKGQLWAGLGRAWRWWVRKVGRANCFSASWHLPGRDRTSPGKGQFPGVLRDPNKALCVCQPGFTSVHTVSRSLLAVLVPLGAERGRRWRGLGRGAPVGPSEARTQRRKGARLGRRDMHLLPPRGDTGWPSLHPQPAWDRAQQSCPQPRICPQQLFPLELAEILGNLSSIGPF